MLHKEEKKINCKESWNTNEDINEKTNNTMYFRNNNN